MKITINFLLVIFLISTLGAGLSSAAPIDPSDPESANIVCENGDFMVFQPDPNDNKELVIVMVSRTRISRSMGVNTIAWSFKILDREPREIHYLADNAPWNTEYESGKLKSVSFYNEGFHFIFFEEQGNYFLRAYGDGIPGCMTMPDGEEVCWTGTDYRDFTVPVFGCYLNPF